MKLLRAGLLAGVLLAIGGAAAHDYGAGKLEIDHPWARQTAAAQRNGGVYATIRNTGAEPDRLVAARGEVAEAVELHTHTTDAQGVMRMRPVDAVDLPAGGEARLQPGGLHIMLLGLRQPLEVGQRFPLTLVFEKAGEVPVEVTVESVSYRPPAPPDASGDRDMGHGAGHGTPPSR